jgi:hypothetical protein
MFIEVSDELAVSTFRTKVEYYDPEDGGSQLPRNAVKHLPINTTCVKKNMNHHKFRSRETEFSKNI